MVVTSVQPLDKKRSRIWLDGEFAFVLYKGELRTFKVEEGKKLNDSSYNEIVNTVLPKRAKLRAMNLLKSHTYSVNQLKNKLVEGEYPANIIEDALEYVASYGYTDDRRLCEEYIRIHVSDKSHQRLVQDLMRKGISKDVINDAFAGCEEYGFEQDELTMARQLLKKRGFDPEKEYNSADERNKDFAKQYSFLARKGFSSSVIRSAMNAHDLFD